MAHIVLTAARYAIAFAFASERLMSAHWNQSYHGRADVSTRQPMISILMDTDVTIFPSWRLVECAIYFIAYVSTGLNEKIPPLVLNSHTEYDVVSATYWGR